MTLVRTVLLCPLWFVAAAEFSLQDQSYAASERPNVLFIAIDDLRTSLGCYEDPLAVSPNIDRFAQTARQFNRAYVQQAVCGPSRTSMLTGRLPDHTRVWHNRNRFRDTHPNLITLPQLFKQSGYEALGFGKIFSGNKRELDPLSWSQPEVLRQPGWKNYLLPENQGPKKKQAVFERSDVDDDAYPDGKLASLAIRTLEQMKQGRQPFFLGVGFFRPHLPFNAPRRYWDLYDETSFALSDGLQSQIQEVPSLAAHSHRELGGYRDVSATECLDDEQTRHLRHGYYACVSYVDAQVGRVLDALEQLQLDDDTIVVIWGDHGYSLGEMNRWCKATNFERDTRIPLLIRIPEIPQPGTASDSLVETVDLYPTLAALAGLSSPKDLDGSSVVSILKDPDASGHSAVLSQFNRPWTSSEPESMGYSIRTATHRYTRWVSWAGGEIQAEELYDYSSNASVNSHLGYLIEHRNIAANSPRLLQQMRQQMDKMLSGRGLVK